jgi:hypothetical protein
MVEGTGTTSPQLEVLSSSDCFGLVGSKSVSEEVVGMLGGFMPHLYIYHQASFRCLKQYLWNICTIVILLLEFEANLKGIIIVDDHRHQKNCRSLS